MGWAYMLPIQAVLESISKHWQSLHPGLPSPEIQVAPEEMVDAANNVDEILPKSGDRPKASVLEAPTSTPSGPTSDGFEKTYESMRKLRDEPKTPSLEMPKLKLSESSRDEPALEILPASDEHVASASKAILSLGETLRAEHPKMCAHDANMQILDDGGVRGYSTLLILDKIMEAIIRREKSYPDSPAESSYHPLVPPTAQLWLPCHYFDYIGGIGSGGLIAIILGLLKMDVTNTILASEALLTEVFKTKRWLPVRAFWFWPREKYDHLILEQEIKKIVDQSAPMVLGWLYSYDFAFNEDHCRTVVVAARQNKHQQETIYKPHIFRTYPDSHNSHREFLEDQGQIWQVARATTATASFFQPAIIDGLKHSGGSYMPKNPSLEIYEEVRRVNQIGGTILSIGCGASSNLPNDRGTRSWVLDRESGLPRYIRLNVDNELGQMGMDEWRARSRLRTNIGSFIGRHRSKYRRDQTWIKEPDNLISSNQPSPEQAIPIIQEPYLTPISPKNGSSVAAAVDSESHIPKWFRPKNVTTEAIRKHTREYLDREDIQEKIREVADILVDKRRDRVRCDPERWEKFCFQTWYICKVPNCPRAGEDCGSRIALRRHILDEHSDKFSEEDQARLEATLEQGQIR